MTIEEFDTACQGFCRRRPFRTFPMEFSSGSQLPISHSEVVRNEGRLYVMRCLDGGHVVFAAESVSRLLDIPTK